MTSVVLGEPAPKAGPRCEHCLHLPVGGKEACRWSGRGWCNRYVYANDSKPPKKTNSKKKKAAAPVSKRGKGLARPIVAVDIHTGKIIKEYPTAMAAAIAMDTYDTTVYRCATEKRTKRGLSYTWRFKDEYNPNEYPAKLEVRWNK